MKKILLICCSVFWLGSGTSALYAQEWGFFASAGIGSYRMDDMKYLLESIIETYPVEARVISSFPPFTSSSAGIIKRFYPQFKAGAAYGWATSGSKADYTDYSGSIRTTITGVSHRLGIFGTYTVLGGERLELSLQGRVDVNMTRMNVSSYLIASGYSNGIDNKYKAISPQLSALGELMYNFDKLSLGLEGGYLVDIPGKLKGTGGGPDLTDPSDGRTLLTSDWTGWRAGIKAIFWISHPDF
ncbi:MAG: hypothetical protein ACWGNV_04640 [Bacteroidales bacterium]